MGCKADSILERIKAEDARRVRSAEKTKAMYVALSCDYATISLWNEGKMRRLWDYPICIRRNNLTLAELDELHAWAHELLDDKEM